MKTLAVSWANSFWTGKEPQISDLAKLIFGLSASAVRLEKLGDDKDKYDLDINTKRTNVSYSPNTVSPS